jgi:hypothetical protein
LIGALLERVAYFEMVFFFEIWTQTQRLPSGLISGQRGAAAHADVLAWRLGGWATAHDELRHACCK